MGRFADRNPTVFVVDDEPTIRNVITRWLGREGCEAVQFESGEACLAALKDSVPDAICLDVRMPGLGGLEALQQIKSSYPDVPVLMLTSDVNVDVVVTAMRFGAYDYLLKPVDRQRLLTCLEESMGGGAPIASEDAEETGYLGIIGTSAPMRTLFREIERVGSSDVTVLILGESGTGKELVARALRARSARRNGPYVEVNCAAIPETLQESELFGHEKGAFTDAAERRVGRFEQAHRGTLFLDEVSELSLALQAKLLRAIQEHRFHRVGGTKEVHSDYRLIAASHRDLSNEASAGLFRADLFYRLAVYEVEVAPLRARGDDVLLLARHFLAKFAVDAHVALSEESVELLMTYPWPGNVRELENAMRRASVCAENGRVEPHHLPPRMRRKEPLSVAMPSHRAVASEMQPSVDSPAMDGASAAALPPSSAAQTSTMTLAEIERQAIEDALVRTNRNISEVGRQLGIGRTSLYRKMAKYGLR